MTHKFDIEMTAMISSEVAMNMVVAAVERQTGRQVTDIRVKHDGTKFDGFQLTLDPSTIATPKKHAFKPSKEFIVEHFGAEE